MTITSRRKLTPPDPCSVAALVGVAALLFGVWKLSHASAWIVAGLLLICGSVLIAAGRERQKRSL